MHRAAVDKCTVGAAVVLDNETSAAGVPEGGVEPGNQWMRQAYRISRIAADGDRGRFVFALWAFLCLFGLFYRKQDYILTVDLYLELAHARGNNGPVGKGGL